LWCFLLDFVKIITVQELSERGLKESKNVTHLAETEGLHAHSDPFV
jgi:histidinol dehydrogenase